MSSENDRPFEMVMSELEESVSQLNSGELSLEDALKAFEKGIKLVRESRSLLDSAEQKLIELTQPPQNADLQQVSGTTDNTTLAQEKMSPAQSQASADSIDDIPF